MPHWNALLIAFLIAFASCSIFRWILTQINVRHLRRHGHEIPEGFRGDIDEATLSRMTDYTAESSRFGSIEHVFDDVITLVILLSGFLPWFSGSILSWQLQFILSGLTFFGILALISGMLNIPFSLYSTFVIEKKYGFSTITLRLWITDFIKSLFISAIMMGILLGAFLSLIHYARTTWWLWVWLFFSAFQLLMVWL
ncbi:MAG: M48 family peptidase, partial [bacterium]